MAYKLRNLNKRRLSETNQELDEKNRKPNGTEVNAMGAEVITNICNELIERIFDFLDPQSLLNVAGTCKRLQIAATAKYGQKFGESQVVLFSKNVQTFISYPQQGSQFLNNAVHVFGLTALPFLRHFGAQIPKLWVDIEEEIHIARYINQYCAKTLTEMTIFCDAKCFTIENWPKPFKMVEVVHSSHLGNQFSNLVFWFPNMRKLSFHTSRSDFDSVVFPHLQMLTCTALLDSSPEKRRFESFVHANQQVRWLRIKMSNPQFSDLLKMISRHKSILTLGVRNSDLLFDSKRVKRAQLLRFAREHHAVVELDFFPFLLKADDAVALIRRLNSLKHFQFRLKDRAEYNYFVNQLQQEIGFMFEASLPRGFYTITVVVLKFNR